MRKSKSYGWSRTGTLRYKVSLKSVEGTRFDQTRFEWKKKKIAGVIFNTQITLLTLCTHQLDFFPLHSLVLYIKHIRQTEKQTTSLYQNDSQPAINNITEENTFSLENTCTNRRSATSWMTSQVFVFCYRTKWFIWIINNDGGCRQQKEKNFFQD